MKIVKTTLHVIIGIAFWGYVFALLFIEDTYNPFAGKKDTSSVAEMSQPDSKNREQQAGAISEPQTGISIYTSTDDLGRPQQLHFSGVQSRDVARRAADKKCKDLIALGEGGLYCQEVMFFTQGCFVRYRFGNGSAWAVGATQAQAAEDAERQCKAQENGSKHSCVRDTNMCIAGGDNQGTRHWERGAFGLSKRFEKKNGTGASVTLVVGEGHSIQSRVADVRAKCLAKSNKSCQQIITLEGDQCVAIAYSGNEGYAIRHGGINHKASLRTQAKEACDSASKQSCRVLWKCADDYDFE